jgi:hypothetical protein
MTIFLGPQTPPRKFIVRRSKPCENSNEIPCSGGSALQQGMQSQRFAHQPSCTPPPRSWATTPGCSCKAQPQIIQRVVARDTKEATISISTHGLGVPRRSLRRCSDRTQPAGRTNGQRLSCRPAGRANLAFRMAQPDREHRYPAHSSASAPDVGLTEIIMLQCNLTLDQALSCCGATEDVR